MCLEVSLEQLGIASMYGLTWIKNSERIHLVINEKIFSFSGKKFIPRVLVYPEMRNIRTLSQKQNINKCTFFGWKRSWSSFEINFLLGRSYKVLNWRNHLEGSNKNHWKASHASCKKFRPKRSKGRKKIGTINSIQKTLNRKLLLSKFKQIKIKPFYLACRFGGKLFE
jgi:hypothetical protein